LLIDRSAEAPTIVATDEMLFARFGSGVVDDTAAVLVRLVACAGAVTTTVMVPAVDPEARAARVHVTDTLPLFVHDHPAPTADTNETPAGNESVTDTFAASDGPRLDTTKT
jgi:hypothetical protein